MDQMTVAEAVKMVADIGMTAALLILFVVHFLRKDKDSDKKVAQAHEESQQKVTAAYEECQQKIAETYRDAQEKIEAANRTIREREDMLIRTSAEREEMLRQESRKREEMLRQESEKRESILILNMDRIAENMKEITQSLNTIREGFSSMDKRLERIEGKVGADE